MIVNTNQLLTELKTITSRSGGPGGQHVNKVETKVTLKWSIEQSQMFSELQKEIIRVSCKSKINKQGEIIVSSDSKRSQIKNKEIAVKKLERLIAKSFNRKKPRKATQPTKASKLKRLDDKKRNADKKSLRKKLYQ
jgi:ribosome-associated protein